MKDFMQGWLFATVGAIAGSLIAHVFFVGEEQKFMQSQKAACESELTAGHECVLVFEYVVVEK